MTTIRERKHRLSSILYRGMVAVSFTACIASRKPQFTNAEVFTDLSQIIFDSLKRWSCDAHVYLFMPDHCHLLIQGKSADSDLLGFMKDFKQRSGYWFYKYCSRNLYGCGSAGVKPAATIKWQKDFYDHILRKDEDIGKQVRYILENPLRKGLVENWKEYPYKGSTLHDFETW